MQPQPSPEPRTFTQRLADALALIRRSAERKPRPGMLSTGELAELRRFETAGPGGPAVWRLLAQFFPGEPADALPRWACAFAALAQLAGNPPGKSLGEALGEAGFSEMRLLRLLRASGAGLFTEVRATSRFLSQKGTPVNPVDLALLVVGLPGEAAEKLRRDIARSFYRALHRSTEA